MAVVTLPPPAHATCGMAAVGVRSCSCRVPCLFGRVSCGAEVPLPLTVRSCSCRVPCLFGRVSCGAECPLLSTHNVHVHVRCLRVAVRGPQYNAAVCDWSFASSSSCRLSYEQQPDSRRRGRRFLWGLVHVVRGNHQNQWQRSARVCVCVCVR